MNYTETKKEIDKIAHEYRCTGDIIMRTAIQYLLECGQQTFADDDFVNKQIAAVNKRHDEAEADGKILLIARDLEIEIIECAHKLAAIPTYDLIIYIQKEMYWSDEGGPDYGRMVHLIDCLIKYIIAEAYGEYDYDGAREMLEDIGFDDNELKYFNFKE